MLDLSSIDKTDWTTLKGAYGPSSAVPDALRVLALEKDPESDLWSDAMNDVVLAHVWHQGDIYPVTPHALPFLIAIANETQSAGRDQIAVAVGLIAQAAARYATEGANQQASLGRMTLDVLAAQASTIAGWFGGELDEQASFIASVASALSDRLFSFLMQREHLASWHYLALWQAREIPGWAFERAESAVLKGGEAPVAAAVLLQRKSELSEPLARRVDELTASAMRPKLELALSCPWDLPEFRFPLRSAPTGNLVPCQVVFVGASLVYVQHPTAGRVMLRVGATGLSAGDTLLVELSPAGLPRVIEYTNATGEKVRRTLE